MKENIPIHLCKNMNELEEYNLLKSTKVWLNEQSQVFIDKLNNGTATPHDRKQLNELKGRYLHLRREINKNLEE